MNEESPTTVSLIAGIRLDPHNPQLWDRFVRRYGPRIYDWCQRRGLQPADCEDVTHDVLLKLAHGIGSVSCDPAGNVRGWLWRVAQNAINDLLAARGREKQVLEKGKLQNLLGPPEAQDDLCRTLEAEWLRECFEIAGKQVQRRVAAHTWQAFLLTAGPECGGQGLADDEAARRLGVAPAIVYRAKYVVRQRLKREMDRLEQGDSDTGRAAVPEE